MDIFRALSKSDLEYRRFRFWFILAPFAMIAGLIAVFLLIVGSSGCASLAPSKKWTFEREVVTTTGKYKVYRTSCAGVQEYWSERVPRHIPVCSMADWERGIILYCEESCLEQEIRNVQSYRELMETAERDRLYRIWREP